MLPMNLLRAAFIAAIFLFPWATAAPIPAGEHTNYVSNQHDKHSARVKAALKVSSDKRARPGQVHMYNIAGTDGHMSGSVLVDPNHVKGMSAEELHLHAQAAADHIRKHIDPNTKYHVQAHHTKGDAHVMIHAAPNSHVTTTKSNQGNHAMILPSHPNRPRPNAPHLTLTPEDRGFIHDALSYHHDPNSGTDKNHLFTEYPPPHTSHHTVHGPVRLGTIPVSHPHLVDGMSAGGLHTHADWIHDNLVPDWQKHQVYIHAKHKAGHEHVEYKIVPAREHVTPEEVKSFIKDRGSSHFKVEPYWSGQNKKPGMGQYNFMGTVPAHTRKTMDTTHLDVYAEQARKGVIKHNNLVGDDADGMSMSTTHKGGINMKEVHFQTQPKTERLLKYMENESGYTAMNDALRGTGQTMTTLSGQVVAHRHSDPVVLETSARVAGIHRDDTQGFLNHLNGHVLGNAGQGDRPCNACHNTFKRLNAGVIYTDMDRYR